MITELGKTYKDKVTGFVGIAVSRTEFLYACERVALQTQSKDGEIKEGHFDAPQLELVVRGKTVQVDEKKLTRTGGTRPGTVRARSSAR